MLDDVNPDDRKALHVAGVKHGKAIISLENPVSTTKDCKCRLLKSLLVTMAESKNAG